MDTKRFRTRTEIIPRANGEVEGNWLAAIDLGYSGVKIISPNKVASFPAFAMKVEKDFHYAGTPPVESILYRPKNVPDNGELWLVGEVAQDTIKSGDTTITESILYSRDRYNDPMFKVVACTALGIACMPNEYGELGPNDNLVVQTGLPERYMEDKHIFQDVLAGTHRFELRIGSGEWQSFEITVKENSTYVMSQPKGTLFSACSERSGAYTADATKFLSSSVLIFDAGFGTLDLFPIHSGVVGHGETFDNLGMKRVLQETSKLILDNYNVSVSVPELQACLKTGSVKYVNRRALESCTYEFGDLLEQASKAVCEEAISRTMDAVNLADFNYFIITGGTGAAWQPYIRDKFKKFETLLIKTGNDNDNLPMIYSNVRGYFLSRLNYLIRHKNG